MSADPLRRLAQERGRILGELGVRSQDARWVEREADTLVSLLSPSLSIRLPGLLDRLRRKLGRLLL